ncbi:DUF4922 domain-containing protein [Bacteroides sp. 214]|uniref:DUF4922 domain-containing protein n=1 Tax=Bacteroides sp. 214 TaxID=2302935 RepID=UPI0013D092AC|nr:DUF4922 domain-containing protein [Bacteroides sp. 214]NDW12517.1 DUF4922 domain-containing protein [Bacteroides sp. 214]
MNSQINRLFEEQLTSWEQARVNYAALSQVKEKSLQIGGYLFRVQFNPARITSSAAKIDTKSIQERKCFLCGANLPEQQKAIPFKEHYQLLVNPFPIFPRHLTIPDVNHTQQCIGANRMEDMLDLAEELNEYILFYNGPKCGASAPDHMHFQAGNKGFLPVEEELKHAKKEEIISHGKASLYYLTNDPRSMLFIESADKQDAVSLFQVVYNAMTIPSDSYEPMMNVLAWYETGKWMVCVFPREKHRPDCFFAEGEKNLLSSPASVDLGGVFIMPVEKDFLKITATDVALILDEVCLGAIAFKELRRKIKEQL